MSDQRNLFLAIALSLAVLLGFQYLFELPRVREQQQREAARPAQQVETGAVPRPEAAPAPGAAQVPGVPGEVTARAERVELLAKTPRVTIASPRLSGSISLIGGRVDDLTLTDYKQSIDKGSPAITLLKPRGAPDAYYADFGFSAAERDLALPGPDTEWRASGDRLSPDRELELSWDNGEGLRFTRILQLDGGYMFTVRQRVENYGGKPVTLYPYGRISRVSTPETLGFYILHEGPLGVFQDTLKEIDYDDVQEAGRIALQSTGGWIGITDKYWLAALVPDQEHEFTGTFRHSRSEQDDRYQVDYLAAAMTLEPGGSAETVNRLFAGAKEVRLLDRYEQQLGVARFDLAVDFGWFYFLTKPLFLVLDYFYRLLGNFGLAILVLTVCIKLVFFPLANKSYKAMSRMKALQPEMTKLREKFGEDRQKLNQEMMALYKREKVNPASGCLPIVIQIPVFFALYKVLFVTIEMRHAPFYGWIRDLSAPDPTSMFNLFGLIPWQPPELMLIGIWPLLMGISMFLQQKLNPQPADPVQAKVFLFMPIFFTFLLARFPAGLVIYWTWNNVLSIAQQWVIMKRMGVPIGGK